jgi:hypothetical protein
VFGKPAAGACATDFDCNAFGNFASCNTATGQCERRTHPVQSDDAQCPVCHTPDGGGLSPVPARHEIYAYTRTRGLQLLGAQLTGATGASGSFQIGDTPVLTFRLVDRTGAPVADLKTNATLSGTVIVSGPTDDRQRVYGPLTMKSAGTLTLVDASSGSYSYTLPGPFPAASVAPYNVLPAPTMTRANGPGTYTLWAYVNDSVTVAGSSVRGAANASIDFALGAAAPTRPRQVVTDAACNACHVVVQAHGGSRAGAGSLCSTCHTEGSVDRTVGSKGVACTTSATCAAWETCTAGACVIATDPTPGQPIDFSILVHDIHYARLRGGYAERNNFNAGKLQVVGFNNGLNDFTDVLLPVDVRNCATCHADAGGSCSASAPCGVGQRCSGGTCVNDAWLHPSKRVCTSCHDEDATFGHAAIMTWTDPSGAAVETCEVCHGEGAAYAVDHVHALTNPWVPPYSREPQ